ncbi:DUF2000 domain-containing protein [Nocardioides sp. ChNu-153]|nr:DUF2000 domain-containing protein [Nocardioides sp. ChNu-99]MDN7121561.1 DUF2000 domain-containing protein [Nocardioides sp. ChNu-153]
MPPVGAPPVGAPPVGFGPHEVDTAAATRDVPLKWVVVVDETLPPGRAVNAAVCVAGATVDRVPGLLGPAVDDADGSAHPGLPWLGCTVLGAAPDRLAAVRSRAAARDDVALADMPTQAQHTRVYDDYLFAVGRTPSAHLGYYAVSLVGPRRVVDRLTKGLRLLP